ncbi:hypothetical protein ACEV6Q_26955 [Enterobacter ludwigii]|uniref:hypothetical protein n=1 Tax=Enterobacter ludwigii TaxID=299767 RepID=UPI003BEEDD60
MTAKVVVTINSHNGEFDFGFNIEDEQTATVEESELAQYLAGVFIKGVKELKVKLEEGK